MAKRVKLPYTILLVLIGLLIVPIAQQPQLAPALGFLDDMVLTPQLLFFIFLPILIFESCFSNADIQSTGNGEVLHCVRMIWTISTHYNTPDRISGLLRKISSEIIRRCAF